MNSIWKFDLIVTAEPQEVMMPKGAKILTVQVQGGINPVLWAECNAETEVREKRTIIMLGTGWRVANFDPLEYIGTVQLGPLVWHFYEFTEVLILLESWIKAAAE